MSAPPLTRRSAATRVSWQDLNWPPAWVLFALVIGQSLLLAVLEEGIAASSCVWLVVVAVLGVTTYRSGRKLAGDGPLTPVLRLSFLVFSAALPAWLALQLLSSRLGVLWVWETHRDALLGAASLALAACWMLAFVALCAGSVVLHIRVTETTAARRAWAWCALLLLVGLVLFSLLVDMQIWFARSALLHARRELADGPVTASVDPVRQGRQR